MSNNKKECNGCGICAIKCPKKCIEMIENKEGFLYPRTNKKECINCKICENECPANNIVKYEEKQTAYALQLKEEEMLLNCASGGAFYSIATEVINNGGAVCGVSEYNNQQSRFEIITTMEKLREIVGSKYYQCNLTPEILERLNKELEKRQVLFGGTPCQVAAVKKIIKKDRINNLITMDIICQGVPSYKCINRYRIYKEKKENKTIKTHYFRCKDKYVGKNYLSKYIFDDETTNYYIGEEDFISCAFQRQIFLRESCYSCKFATNNRVGDITMGDLWKLPKLESKKFKLEKGISIVVCNTNKGKKMIENCNIINKEEIDLYDNTKDNIPFYRPVKRPVSRNISYNLLFSKVGPKWTLYICCPKYAVKKMLNKFRGR